MHQPAGLEDFENLLHSLARALIRETEAELQNQSWLAIVLDVRFDHHGGFIDKIRATTPDRIASISMPTDVVHILLSLDSLRQRLLYDWWYGIQLKVDANRRCEAKYNYDPNCANDLTFYAD
jgi:hypothetical protein